jgi:hypothetical protein
MPVRLGLAVSHRNELSFAAVLKKVYDREDALVST